MSDSTRPRVCYECSRFDITNYSPGYSRVTPGDEFSMGCSLGIWDLDTSNESEMSFHEKITMAETCEEFSLAKWVNQITKQE